MNAAAGRDGWVKIAAVLTLAAFVTLGTGIYYWQSTKSIGATQTEPSVDLFIAHLASQSRLGSLFLFNLTFDFLAADSNTSMLEFYAHPPAPGSVVNFTVGVLEANGTVAAEFNSSTSCWAGWFGGCNGSAALGSGWGAGQGTPLVPSETLEVVSGSNLAAFVFLIGMQNTSTQQYQVTEITL